MKKLCIQTWFSSLNFGTCLQAYALFRVLTSNSYSVFFADGIGPRHNLTYRLKLFVAKMLHRQPRWATKRMKTIGRWSNQYLTVRWAHSSRQIEQLINDTDCFISGSDQIWNTHFTFAPEMFLSFAKNKKRISYASSIGTNNVNPRHATTIKSLLTAYSHISVREETGASELRQLTGRSDIHKVADPTVLLSREDWTNIIAAATRPPKLPAHYALVYLLGDNPNYSKIATEIVQAHDIENVVLVPSLERPNLKLKAASVVSNIDPIQFASIIASADLVCTDSFHATMLSIIFQRPFIELMRFSDSDDISQNSRIYDLLNHLDLKAQIYHANSIPDISINFAKSERILQLDRERSLNFLLNAIER